IKYMGLLIGVLGLYNWKKLSQPIRIFSLYWIVIFLNEVISGILMDRGLNLNHIGLVNSLEQLILFFFIYFLAMRKPTLKWSFVILVSCLLLFDISFWIYDGARSKSIFILAINSGALLCLCLYHFYQLIKTPVTNVLNIPMFWISTGLIISLSVSVILYAANHYLYPILKDDLIDLWSFRNYLTFGSYGFFLYAIWLDVKMSPTQT
ncbi:MAG: hypothetical protein KDC93_14800, partial [Cyclobacteriaceae bacterium]|nr:hypothetical protein [Cyclobacteriaceae bacterium]